VRVVRHCCQHQSCDTLLTDATHKSRIASGQLVAKRVTAIVVAAMKALSNDLAKMTSVFEQQLERGVLQDPADIAMHAVRLLRHAALSGWGESGEDMPSKCRELALETVALSTGALLDAGPLHCCIEGVSHHVSMAVRASESRAQLSSELASLVSSVTDARTALNDHAVSAIAGGSPSRCVVILGVKSAGGASEEAVSEAAGDMDRVDVIVVSILPDDGLAAGRMAARLRAVDGVAAAEVADLSTLANVFQTRRVHAVLLDTFAVDRSDGVAAPCGAAMVAASARQSAVRVFALTTEHSILPAGACTWRTLRTASDHPGPVMPYDLAHAAACRIKVLNPVSDLLPIHQIDVLVSSSGVVVGVGS
jgi:translation initiation factor 2B subunit (eIF-2B alpha/beta/delta family)